MDTSKILNSIFTAIIVGMLTYIGATVYKLDKWSVETQYKTKAMSEKITATNLVLQDIYETKGTKSDTQVLFQECDSKIIGLEGELNKLRIDVKNSKNQSRVTRPTRTKRPDVDKILTF